MSVDISNIDTFDWDAGNLSKNSLKHNVTNKETEEVFSNDPLVSEDVKHSDKEKRFRALGKTNNGRLLFIVFTLRTIKQEVKIRIISARDTNKKEEVDYEKT